MKRILIVCPYPPGKAASQRFRFEQYLDLLAEWNLAYRQCSFWSDKHWPAIYKEGAILLKVYATLTGFIRRFCLLFTLHRYDRVFIHREASPIGWPWWEWCAAKIWRKPLIFDFDDAIWLPNSSSANAPLVGKFKAHGKTSKILRWSKLAMVGNDFLGNYALKFCRDVRIVPTSIDTENWHNPAEYVKPEKPGMIIGWTGTHSTLKQLIPLFPVLSDLHQQHNFKLLIIADRAPDKLPVFATFMPWNKVTEIEDLMRFDIGIMPLYDSDWEKGKCGFKALQYMALEIPAIVSGVGVNTEILRNGQEGFIAEAMPPTQTTKWENALISLLNDAELRHRCGLAGRQRVIDYYSVLALQDRYREIFTLT